MRRRMFRRRTVILHFVCYVCCPLKICLSRADAPCIETAAIEHRIDIKNSGNPHVHTRFQRDGPMCKTDTTCDTLHKN